MLFEVFRENGSYGHIYLQWEIIGVEAEKCFPKTSGDLWMGSGQNEAHLQIPTSGNYIKDDVGLVLQTEVLTQGVILDEDSCSIPFLLSANCGTMSVNVNKCEVEWPLEDDGAEIGVTREGNTKGCAEIQWRIEGVGEGYPYFPVSKGSLKLDDGESSAILKLPINKTEAGPRQDTEFKVRLTTSSPGLKLNTDDVTIILKQHKPGVIEMRETSLQVDQEHESCVVAYLHRYNGCEGDVSVTYEVETFAPQFEDEAKSGRVVFGNKCESGEIRIPLPQTEHADEIVFNVRLVAGSGGVEIGDRRSTEVTLMPFIIEPPSVVEFRRDTETQVDSTTDDSVVTMLTRRGGTRRSCRVFCSTEDGTAKAGLHYLPCVREIVFQPHEESKSVSIKLLPAKYRKELQFKVKVLPTDHRALLGDASTININLKRTEHPGRFAVKVDHEVTSSNAESVSLKIQRENGTGGRISMQYRTKDGSAKADEHFKEVSGCCVLKDDEMNGEIKIPLLRKLYRESLFFDVEFYQPSEDEVLPDTSIIRVNLPPTDTEPVGKLFFDTSQPIVVSGALPQTIFVPVQRLHGAGGEMPFIFKTEPNTAIDGVHYEGVNKLLSLKDRQTATEIPINVRNFPHLEPLYFDVIVLDPQQKANQCDSLRQSILLQPTREPKPGHPSFMHNSVEIDAGSEDFVKILVSRIGGSDGNLSTRYRTREGTAKAGVHYQNTEDILMFGNGEDIQTIFIPLLNKQYRDPLNFSIELLDSSYENPLGTTTVNLVPTNKELQGKVFLMPKMDVDIHGPENKIIDIPLFRSEGTGGDVTVHIKTKDDSAKDGIHYKGIDQEIVLKDGQHYMEFPVVVFGENCQETLNFVVEISDRKNEGVLGEFTKLNVNIILPQKATLPNETTDEPDRPSLHQRKFWLLSSSVTASSADDGEVVITLNKDKSQQGKKVEIPFQTLAGSAKPRKHFVPTKSKVVFPPESNEGVARISLVKSRHRLPLNFSVEFEDGDKKYPLIVVLKETIEEAPGRIEFRDSALSFSSPIKKGVNDVASVVVCRRDGARGDVEVDFASRDNTAVSGLHYDDVTATLKFADGESEKLVEVAMLPRSMYSKNLSFFLELGSARGGAEIGEVYEVEVTLEAPLDEDDPGILGFDSPNTYFSSKHLRDKRCKDLQVPIHIGRSVGCGGDVAVGYSMRDNTAISGRHFREVTDEMEFGDKEISKNILVPLIPGRHFKEPVSFTAELGATSGGAEVGVYETVVLLDPMVGRESFSESSTDENSSSSSSSDSDEMEFTEEWTKRTSLDYYASQVQVQSDEPSEISFPHDFFQVLAGIDKEANIPLVRSFSDVGRVAVEWFTREHSAEAGRDFVESNGWVVFDDGQKEATLSIPLLHPDRNKNGVSFIVELGQVEGNTFVGKYEAVVEICSEGKGKSLMVVVVVILFGFAVVCWFVFWIYFCLLIYNFLFCF